MLFINSGYTFSGYEVFFGFLLKFIIATSCVIIGIVILIIPMDMLATYGGKQITGDINNHKILMISQYIFGAVHIILGVLMLIWNEYTFGLETFFAG